MYKIESLSQGPAKNTASFMAIFTKKKKLLPDRRSKRKVSVLHELLAEGQDLRRVFLLTTL